jgi:hypothetical protein
MLHDLDVGTIYELKIYGRMDNAFTIRLGQRFMIKGAEVFISSIYRDKNYLELYNVKRYIVEVQLPNGDNVIWKYFEGVDVEVTNKIDV